MPSTFWGPWHPLLPQWSEWHLLRKSWSDLNPRIANATMVLWHWWEGALGCCPGRITRKRKASCIISDATKCRIRHVTLAMQKRWSSGKNAKSVVVVALLLTDRLSSRLKRKLRHSVLTKLMCSQKFVWNFCHWCFAFGWFSLTVKVLVSFVLQMRTRSWDCCCNTLWTTCLTIRIFTKRTHKV